MWFTRNDAAHRVQLRSKPEYRSMENRKETMRNEGYSLANGPRHNNHHGPPPPKNPIRKRGNATLSDAPIPNRDVRMRIPNMENTHSDITIRNRRVAQCRVTPFPDRIFRRGRAMMVVMSRPVGQAISFISHSFFAIFHTSVLWFASQLNTMCCIVSGEPHFVQVPLSLRFVILSQYLPHLRASWMSFHSNAFYFYFPWPGYNT